MSPTEGVLGEAWNLFKAHWQHFVTIALAVYLVVAAVGLVLQLLLDDWAASILTSLVALVGTFWLQGALVKAVDDVRDGRADLSLTETFDNVRPYLVRLIVAVFPAAVAIIVGFFLLIAPGLLLLTWWIALVPAIVLEGRTPGEAFGRSRELVRGYGWSVCGVAVLTILLWIASRIVLELVLFPLSNALQSFVTELVVGVVVTPFIVAAWTLLYFRLRRAKEETAPVAAEPAT